MYLSTFVLIPLKMQHHALIEPSYQHILAAARLKKGTAQRSGFANLVRIYQPKLVRYYSTGATAKIKTWKEIKGIRYYSALKYVFLFLSIFCSELPLHHW